MQRNRTFVIEFEYKIDPATGAQIDCRTCLHMITHTACSGCMSGSLPSYEYKNWVYATEAEQEAEIDRLLQSGERNIVIGYSGEAECNAKWDYRRTLDHLVNISEQCGYLTQGDGVGRIRIMKDSGEHILRFDGDGLKSVENGRMKQWERRL